LKYGSLKLLDPSGAVLARTGIALHLALYYIRVSLQEDRGVPGTTSVMTAILQLTLESKHREYMLKVDYADGTFDSIAF
jgi:hypothetical protein